MREIQRNIGDATEFGMKIKIFIYEYVCRVCVCVLSVGICRIGIFQLILPNEYTVNVAAIVASLLLCSHSLYRQSRYTPTPPISSQHSFFLEDTAGGIHMYVLFSQPL